MYRKDITQLSNDELTALIRAFNALWDNGTITEYVDLHRSSFTQIHWGPAFLPWHRFFLREFEKKLQEIDNSITLPYWDWTRSDSRDLGNGFWHSRFGGWSGKRQWTESRAEGSTGDLDWIINRRAARPRQPLPELVDDPNTDGVPIVLKELDKATFPDFRTLESGSHVRGHVWVGEDMRQPSLSPIDPLFYLHHCNIDRLWAIWQQNNPDADEYSLRRVSGDRNDNARVAPTANMAWFSGESSRTPVSVLDHTSMGYLYERDVLLETSWYEQNRTVLETGDTRSADLFIRDSKADKGEYPSPEVHWTSPDIWVRNTEPNSMESNTDADHDVPIVDQSNYMYVRVRNRGTEPAKDVTVKAYNADPGTGLLWPRHFNAIGQLNVLGGVASGASVIVGPFPWTPKRKDHECLLAIVDSPDDPTTMPMFIGNIAHWKLVRFDNSVGQRNVFPIRVALKGNAKSNIGMHGGPERSVNGFRLDASTLPKDTNLRLRVANSVLQQAELRKLTVERTNKRFTTLRARGGEAVAINGFPLHAGERKVVGLDVDFSARAEHGRRYPVIATQTQDGELAGRLTIELVAIKDYDDYMIGNKNTKELHLPNCTYSDWVKPANRVPFATAREARALGYDGCHYCLPEYDAG
ncbi:MAG: tyrosinase family protein [Acidobacteria bacterium]|nr:tyrosinase family protein [Acidobacteriota bacterium]MYG74205.1 tyrosinase family protein [Acidobacteriota bacterium]